MPICNCGCAYSMWMLGILDEKVDEKWIHINNTSQSHWITIDKQIFFAILICTIELTC
jgi:hypothetical protein